MITRIIYSAVALLTFLSLIPDTGTASELETVSHVSGEATHAMASDAHAVGPHIPLPKGDAIEGWQISGINITNTIFSTWIFMILISILVGVFYVALTTDKFPRLKAFGLDITARILAYTT